MSLEIGGSNLDEGIGSVFSMPMLVAMGICLAIGAVFAAIATQSSYERSLFEAQTSDAQMVRDGVKPKVAAFNDFLEKLKNTPTATVSFEAAEEMAKADFTISGNILSSNRLLLGPEVIDYVVSYASDSAMLEEMLENHARLTTKVDKEELEALVKENEILANDRFGVIFDYKDVLSRGGNEDYVPGHGKLVAIKKVGEGEDNKVTVELLGSGQEAQVEPQGLIQLDKGQILKSGGDNALQRYQRRMRNIQFQADKVSKYTELLMESLNKLADRESAPILMF